MIWNSQENGTAIDAWNYPHPPMLQMMHTSGIDDQCQSLKTDFPLPSAWWRAWENHQPPGHHYGLRNRFAASASCSQSMPFECQLRLPACLSHSQDAGGQACEVKVNYHPGGVTVDELLAVSSMKNENALCVPTAALVLHGPSPKKPFGHTMHW